MTPTSHLCLCFPAQVLVLRGGRMVAFGTWQQLSVLGLPELGPAAGEAATGAAGQTETQAQACADLSFAPLQSQATLQTHVAVTGQERLPQAQDRPSCPVLQAASRSHPLPDIRLSMPRRTSLPEVSRQRVRSAEALPVPMRKSSSFKHGHDTHAHAHAHHERSTRLSMDLPVGCHPARRARVHSLDLPMRRSHAHTGYGVSHGARMVLTSCDRSSAGGGGVLGPERTSAGPWSGVLRSGIQEAAEEPLQGVDQQVQHQQAQDSDEVGVWEEEEEAEELTHGAVEWGVYARFARSVLLLGKTLHAQGAWLQGCT